jgi:hypothetical protein
VITRTLLLSAVAFTVTFLLAACGTRAELGCRDNAECAQGEACILPPAVDGVAQPGTCQDVECLASAECGIREYCDPDTYVCRAGCTQDVDCRAGETCNTDSNTCEAYGCRDTELDCSVGERCNAVTGQCERDARDLCAPCQEDFWRGRYVCPGNPGDGECYVTREDQRVPTCGHYCDPDAGDDPVNGCPAGFSCSPLQPDNVTVCVADCEFLESRGWY